MANGDVDDNRFVNQAFFFFFTAPSAAFFYPLLPLYNVLYTHPPTPNQPPTNAPTDLQITRPWNTRRDAPRYHRRQAVAAVPSHALSRRIHRCFEVWRHRSRHVRCGGCCGAEAGFSAVIHGDCRARSHDAAPNTATTNR